MLIKSLLEYNPHLSDLLDEDYYTLRQILFFDENEYLVSKKSDESPAPVPSDHSPVYTEE